MAVTVDDGPHGQRWRLVALALEELGEQQRLVGEPSGVVVVREQVHELVTKGGHAARFESDDGIPARIHGRNVSSVWRHKRSAVASMPEVVERPPAAQRPRGYLDRVAGIFEHLDRGSSTSDSR